jgi:hypothetical protein
MGTASISGTVSGGTVAVVDAASNTEVRRIASTGYAAGLKSFSMPLAIGKSYNLASAESASHASNMLIRQVEILISAVNQFKRK